MHHTKPFLFALLAITGMMNNNAQALRFIEVLVECTNDDDGLLTNSMFLASQSSCQSFGATSMNNGCDSGIFTSYNSTDCTGDVLGTIPRDTCTASGLKNVIYRCSSYDDAEYLRQTIFQTEDGQGAADCNSPVKVESFARLDFCYPGNQPGSLSFKYEKLDATTWQGTSYNDAECDSVNRTLDGNADGACQGNLQMDFFTAPLPSASPSQEPTPSSPSAAPTGSPTQSSPSVSPSAVPTGSPTQSKPTASPSAVPSRAPTLPRPTSSPSAVPTKAPTPSKPTSSPSLPSPTSAPSNPTSSPSAAPSHRPPRSNSANGLVQSAGIMTVVTMLVAGLVV